jgi:tRNA A-37 threonylcarbamoyl transferase component Bud32/tetratricopeptide (TPR) repeat protein
VTESDIASASDAGLPPEAVIKACREALAANMRPAQISERLRAVAAAAAADPALKAQWLLAKGIVTNRLGFRDQALGDLNEAADLFSQLNDRAHLAEAKREAAVVHAWCGDGREAGLDLLRAIAESFAAKDMAGTALAIAEAGRLELEMGRPQAAAPLFDRALNLPDGNLTDAQKHRAQVGALQARVAAGQIDEALQFRRSMAPDLVDANPRMHHLVAIEDIRCAIAQHKFDDVQMRLQAARAQLPADNSFEATELAEAEAELALADSKFALAEAKLKEIIAALGEPDLAGREVRARLLQAKAFDGLGRKDDAQKTLSKALRLAVMRGLPGHADKVRFALAASGGSENMASWDSYALSPTAQDPARRFIYRKPLGAGGQGSVYRACDLELGGDVAIKSVDLAQLYDPAQRDLAIETARTEVAAASRIDHPGVVRVRGLIVEPNGKVILVEDLVNGPSLRAVLQGAGRSMTSAQALDLITKIAYALSTIHAARIVHCDLKPDNVMLSGATQPVIVDFGIALLGLNERSGRGTPAYMAPEQKEGGRIDARTDLFALGVMALELLGVAPKTGRRFWRHDNGITKSLRSAGITQPCISLLRRMVAPAKWLRPRSAADVSRIIVASTANARDS